MSRISPLTLFVLTPILIVLLSGLVLSSCPECYKDNHAPMNGPSSGENPARRTISVQIDSTWGTPTNSSIWNATCAGTGATNCPSGTSALSEWNNQTDQYGNKTGYFLSLQQDSQSPQIIIKLGAVGANECASTDLNGPPYVISLPRQS